MNKIMLILVFTCVYAQAYTQVNYVKNPSFEEYSKCPDDWNQVHYAKGWRNVKDSVWEGGLEYYNKCGNVILDKALHIPDNTGFWQNCHYGNGMVGVTTYFDKTTPLPTPLPFNYRDNLQGHLINPLVAGKSYCVSFWVNLTESSGYAQNKIGAYLDDGTINSAIDSPGKEITSVTPQIYSSVILSDTANWEKIEGSFVATGNETYISIGNFFDNSVTSVIKTNYWFSHPVIAYYLFDDISVIPIDLKAEAGADRWVEQTKAVQIGRVGDTTTMGLDCKWYKKGILIDSGAIITVNANAIKYAVDTYVLVQTICGIVKTDTVAVRTVGLGDIPNLVSTESKFSVYPNPSNGIITISTTSLSKMPIISVRGTKQSLKVYDLLGREVHQSSFTNETTIQLNTARGTYILELKDAEGNVQRERIVIE